MKPKSLSWSLVLALFPATLFAQTDLRTYWWKGGPGPDGQDREGNFASMSPQDAGASPQIGENETMRSLVSRFYGIPTEDANGNAINRYDLTMRRVLKAIADIQGALAESDEFGFGTDRNTTAKAADPLPAGQRVFLPSPQAIDSLLSGELEVDEVLERELATVDNQNALAGMGRSTPFATGPLGADYPADQEDDNARPVTLLGITMARALNPDGTAPPPHPDAESSLAAAAQTGLTRRAANSAILYDYLVERWSQQLGVSGAGDTVELGRSAGGMGFDM